MPTYMTSQRWLKLAFYVAGVTAVCCIVSCLYCFVSFARFGPAVQAQAIINCIILPLILAPPVVSFLALKLFQLAALNAVLDRVASEDVLTRCLTRRAFTERVLAALSGNNDPEAIPAGALLVVDADNFKNINDEFGHLGGDAALQAIADALRSALRDTDMIGRLGGEEFGLFLPGASAKEATEIAERVVTIVAATVFMFHGKVGRLAVSVGGAYFTGEVAFEELYRTADHRLYEAKGEGRNRAIVSPLAA